MKIKNLINRICFSITLWLYLKDVNKQIDEWQRELDEIKRRIMNHE